MKSSHNVATYTVDARQNTRGRTSMLEGEIPDARIFYHSLPSGEETLFPTEKNLFRAIFVIQGTVVFSAGGASFSADKRAIFVPAPAQPSAVTAQADARLLEVQKRMDEEDMREYGSYPDIYPYFKAYDDCVQYADRNTSAKTIKREIVKQRIIPRFAMGSCESYGYDTMGVSSHPHLDQMFFSLPACDIQVLIDDQPIRLTENTLLHIPLGARHGVIVPEGNYMHYIWVDYMASSSGADGLDKGHVPTGKHRSF